MTTHNRPWSSKSRTSFKNTERSYSDGNNTRKEILPSISNVNEDSIRERVWAHNFLVNECTMKDIIKRANQIRLDNLQEKGNYKNRPFSRQSNGFQSLITDLSPSPWSQNEYISKKDIKPQIKILAGKRAKSAPAQKIKNNSLKFYECDSINTRLTPKLKSTMIGFKCKQIELKLNIPLADSKRNVINTCRNKRPGTCISFRTVMPGANRPLTPFNCTERIDLPNCLIVPKKKIVAHNDRSIMAEEKELDSVECDLLRNSTEKPPHDVPCKSVGLDDLEPIIADYSSLKMKRCTQTSKYKKNNQSLIEGLFHVVSRGWTEPDHSSLSSFIMEMEQE